MKISAKKLLGSSVTQAFSFILLGLALPASASEPIAQQLLNLVGSPIDSVIMSALLGATLMLVIINIGQAKINNDPFNIWLALYIAAISAAMASGWDSNQANPLITSQVFNRKSFTLLALLFQTLFILRYFPTQDEQRVWRTLFIGINTILLCLGLWLLTINNVNAYKAVRLMFFISGGLCITHMALASRYQIPFTQHILVAKSLVVGLAIIGWSLVHRFDIEQPLFFWFGQTLVIIEGMIVTYALIMHNIMQTRERVQALHERGLKLKLKKQYNQTLKQVDHELRTPLSGIVGIAELLLDTTLNKTQRDQILTMRRASEAQLKWLNRLNDWRSLQIGRLNFDAIAFDFSQLLETLCEDTKVKADDRKINFHYYKNPNTPNLIKGDPERLKQIISGTLDMALFYSEQGQIEVTLKPSSRKNFWRLEIRDSQSGLQADDLQINKSHDASINAETYSSVQRNWVIAQALAEHIGGKLSIKITPTDDSHTALFVCELILTRHSLLRHHENQYDKLLEDKRLLVVDDSSSSRKVVAKRADSWGMKVTCVPNGKDALAMMRTMSKVGGAFDVIVLDHDMPEMTGLELAQAIVKADDIHGLPVMIMLSGASEPPSQEQARSAAIKRVLTKPISAKSLKITLAEEITLHKVRNPQISETSA
jgi:CheY-like chemotaxis protein/signal transduction histidine kinase